MYIIWAVTKQYFVCMKINVVSLHKWNPKDRRRKMSLNYSCECPIAAIKATQPAPDLMVPSQYYNLLVQMHLLGSTELILRREETSLSEKSHCHYVQCLWTCLITTTLRVHAHIYHTPHTHTHTHTHTNLSQFIDDNSNEFTKISWGAL